jgi:hypothetical protein
MMLIAQLSAARSNELLFIVEDCTYLSV